MIQRVERLPEILQLFEASSLTPKSIRMVHPFVDQPANVMILIAKKGVKKGSFEVHPPVITHEKDGQYTAQINAIYHYGS